MPEYEQFGPSSTLDVEGGNRMDENTEVRLRDVEVAFAGYAGKLRERYGSKAAA